MQFKDSPKIWNEHQNNIKNPKKRSKLDDNLVETAFPTK